MDTHNSNPYAPPSVESQAAVSDGTSILSPTREIAHETHSRELYRIIANHLVKHRQHRTCANLNATCKGTFSATLPILFKVVIWRFDWTVDSTLENWIHTRFLPLTRARGAKYIE